MRNMYKGLGENPNTEIIPTSEPLPQLFPRDLRYYRRRAGLSLAEVASRLKVGAPSINKWECGHTSPRVRYLPQLIQCYNITHDELFAAIERSKHQPQ